MKPPAQEILELSVSPGREVLLVMQNKVELCGVNTAKLKVLKNEETQELLRRSKAGG